MTDVRVRRRQRVERKAEATMPLRWGGVQGWRVVVVVVVGVGVARGVVVVVGVVMIQAEKVVRGLVGVVVVVEVEGWEGVGWREVEYGEEE